MPRLVPIEERRARLGVRHHLAGPAPSLDAAVADLVAFHSSDPTSVHLAAWARAPSPGTTALETALYDDRTLVRLLGMRRTMFVVPRSLAGVVDAACTRTIARRERSRLLTMIAGAAVTADDPAAWLARLEEATMAALATRGPSAAAELTRDLPELATKLTAAEGTKWATEVGVASRILFLLGADGRIVRGRPRGTWISSQYRWSRTEDWLGAPMADHEPADARTELARRWLASFGPATTDDLKWWAGWTLRETRSALADSGAVAVDLADGEGWVVAGDEAAVEAPPPWAALLPALDATTMGWKARDWYLGDHGGVLFDRNGNAGPTVWVDGRVVGGWAQDPDGVVVTRLLEDVGRSASALVEARADALTVWFDGLRVTPRFRTPLERELSAGGP